MVGLSPMAKRMEFGRVCFFPCHREPKSPIVINAMIELEVYAAGVRNLEKILELDHELEAVPGLRYKVDSNHDIVYLEFEEPTFTIQEIRSIFRKLGLEPRVVGAIPTEINPKSKTQPLSLSPS